MKQGVLNGSRYSPGNMDRDSLEALFVGRHDIMEDMLSRTGTSISGPQKHYMLLVGPRGSGKTHFLALAYHRLMDRLHRAGLEERVAVAVLKEEEWGVASYLDLVVRILRALAQDAPELDARIDEVYERFSRDPTDAEAFAVALLRQHTESRTLLLLCENLVDLFAGLNEEGQKRWRATIQEDGNWTIVATTPSLFDALRLQDSPFYGFFTIRNLKPIKFQTGVELLARKAVHEGDHELAQFLRTPLGRARARAIHHLAAGNHRAYVVLFDFLDKESLNDLIRPFMRMVDDLTPYYQDQMRPLPPTQRKIIEFLSLRGKPASVKDIATPCLMSHQTAAKQLGELEMAGFVRKMRSGRRTFCELAEPLMRICIEVKDNKTEHFRLLVDFLRHWFTTRELERRQLTFENGREASDLDRMHVVEALRCALADRHEPLVDALHDEAERCWEAGDYRGLASIQETLVQNGGDAEDYRIWVWALVEAGDAKAAIAVGEEAIAKGQQDVELHYWLGYAYLIENRFPEALEAVDRVTDLDHVDATHLCIRGYVLLKLGRFEEAILDARAALDRDPGRWLSLQHLVEALNSLGRPDEAEVHARELLQLAPEEPLALLTVSKFYLERSRLDEALALADQTLDIAADNVQAHHLRGLVLCEIGDYAGASAEFRYVTEHHPADASTRSRLAGALLRSGRFEEAIEVSDQLIAVDPRDAHAHCVRGQALIEIGRAADGISALDALLASDECELLLMAAACVRRLGQHESAARYLDRVAELQPEDGELWVERTLLLIEMEDHEAAVQCAARLATLPGGSLLGRLLSAQATAAIEPLNVALKQIGPVVRPEDFGRDEARHLQATAWILTTSVSHFGPQYLPDGCAKLQELFAAFIDAGVMGKVLTNFVIEHAEHGFPGSLEEWEAALDDIAPTLANQPDCHIPLDMLRAAVTYTKTGSDECLWRVPAEQRELLEDVLPAGLDELP